MKKKLLKLLHNYLSKFLYKKTSYSQDGEDVLLSSFYENRKNYKGFFVDVGAHHPYKLSNTAIFYKKGWHGINIEPTPTLFKSFKKHRKRDINLNIGISNSNEILTFCVFDEPALNSFNIKFSEERNQKGKYKLIDKIQIQTRKLEDVFEQYCKNQKIDFLTIDVEGFDFEVVKSNNWQKFRPEFVLVEHVFNAAKLNEDEIYKFMCEQNYILVSRTQRTSFFRDENNT